MAACWVIVQQVDFVGYAQNPHFKRGLPKGEAARAAGPLRNLRVEHKPEKLDLCAPYHPNCPSLCT